MTNFFRIALILVLPFLMTGCLVTAGKFESEMLLKKNGDFSFYYEGEISVLGMQKLINVAAKSEEDDFEPVCYEEEGLEEASFPRRIEAQILSAETRECSDEEAAEQLAEKKQENEQMIGVFRALFGGVDPSTPEALEELVERTRKQKGWDLVEHRGDGIFDVKYSLSGRMDRNFAFPHFEQAKGATAFVEGIVRKDNKVRIEAPGFAQLEENSGVAQFGTLAALGNEKEEDEINFGEDEEKKLPEGFITPNGTFKLITDGEILTNNTEEGPETTGKMKTLVWKITDRTKSPPVALIRLAE